MRNPQFAILILALLLVTSCSGSKQVELWFNAGSSVASYSAERLSENLESSGFYVKMNRGVKNPGWFVILMSEEDPAPFLPMGKFSGYAASLGNEGYRILIQNDSIFVVGKTDRGCLYGVMELIDQLGPDCRFDQLKETGMSPAFAFRAIKFNLPWAPYRPGPATSLHRETCRDLDYWEAFLDMMVTNRFNSLTLWSNHLFPYMIRAENFPEATPFDDQALTEWQTFWKELFRMARSRGIETYLINWNIVVSPEFAEAYDAELYNDTSDMVKQYTRESVTQLINEYEDLTGLGVTLADWMGNWGEAQMTPKEREEWIEDTFIEGMKQADRKVRFIHRAVLAGDPGEMRKVIDEANLPEESIVEVKFNWSHGHSTPYLSLTHSNDDGTIMRGFWDPEPENYFIAWMVRNEDFFVLRWGNPEFIREHMKINHHSYVDGYFVGSEGYIPARDYSQRKNRQMNWKYGFQKQWLFYHLWGRLAFNPEENDSTLARAFETRYPGVDAMGMMEAYSLASRVPLQIASFYRSTWDFTLYSEGFLAPWTTGYDDGKSPFISLEELIRHETLDSRYLSIGDFTRMESEGEPVPDELITPLELADQLMADCSRAMELIEGFRSSRIDPTLGSELDDLETWCHLGYYFADKIRAGVSLESFRNDGSKESRENTLAYLERCIIHWENVIRMTAGRYRPMPYVSMGHPDQKWPDFKTFHWEYFMKDVKADLEYVLSLENEPEPAEPLD